MEIQGGPEEIIGMAIMSIIVVEARWRDGEINLIELNSMVARGTAHS